MKKLSFSLTLCFLFLSTMSYAITISSITFESTGTGDQIKITAATNDKFTIHDSLDRDKKLQFFKIKEGSISGEAKPVAATNGKFVTGNIEIVSEPNYSMVLKLKYSKDIPAVMYGQSGNITTIDLQPSGTITDETVSEKVLTEAEKEAEEQKIAATRIRDLTKEELDDIQFNIDTSVTYISLNKKDPFKPAFRTREPLDSRLVDKIPPFNLTGKKLLSIVTASNGVNKALFEAAGRGSASAGINAVEYIIVKPGDILTNGFIQAIDANMVTISLSSEGYYFPLSLRVGQVFESYQIRSRAPSPFGTRNY